MIREIILVPKFQYLGTLVGLNRFVNPPTHKYIDKLLIRVNLYLEELMSYSFAKRISLNEPTK